MWIVGLEEMVLLCVTMAQRPQVALDSSECGSTKS